MHIKQVVLSGFRSFRHQSEIEPFSARHNVIIGRNGSGKSNFFAAIQFVLLSQKFMHLRQEERQQLLHEGAGANVMTAFVEVIFDNSDGRMTVEGDEVVLRRTIGVKKDEFFLNRKRVTKQEVSSLLESAGFSRSNPYYIVQQGKVNMLTLMRDDQRLDLLKEVAGTKVYEERRAESLQIIHETDHKREKIQEVVSYIEERLGELDEEKEELRAYQRLDKDRRALEYTLYDTELKGARADLNKAEEARLREIERADDLHRRLHDSRDALQEVEERMEALRLGLEKKSGERGRVEGEREELLAQREGAVNEEKTLWDRVEGEEAKQEDLRAQLLEAEKEIDTVREQLRSTIEPEYNAAKKAVDDLKRELKEKEAIRAELHDKQGRRAAFRSVAERDAHLKKQQAQVGAAVQEREGLIRKNQAEREKALRQVEQEKGQVARREKELGQKEEALAALGQSRSEMVGTRNRNQDIRKQKQEKIAELEDRKSRLEDNIRKAEQTLRFAMPKHIALGLETVARLAEEERISGCYGPVYSLLELKDPKFRQAVEVAAGNSLFNVVVDTDETAAKLMKRLEEERGGGGGRVCFMPLNRLRVKPVSSYPDSADVVPLLSAALTYPRHVDKAMRQIFGLKLLARDLEVAARFSETAGMDAITLDGDEASRKGSMQGGYHDERNSKFAQVLAIRAAKAELRPVTEALQEEEKAHQELDTAMSRLLAEMQKKERDASRLQDEVDTLSREMRAGKQRIEMLVAHIAKIEESLPMEEQSLADMRRQLEVWASELGTPLDSKLSAADTRTLREIEIRLPILAQEIKVATEALQAKASARSRLTYRLNENLVRTKEKLLECLWPEHGGTAHVEKVAMVENRRLLAMKKKEVEVWAARVKDVEGRLAAMDAASEEEKEEERTLKAQAEEERAGEASLKELVAEVAKAQEKLLNKRSMAMQKRDASLKKIQELGSLPAAELELYKTLGIKQLYRRLHECNEELKQYSHVNKKALDQYVNFSEQREELLMRKAELDEGAKAIEGLITNLDRQKDEAIIRTFRGVSKHFADVFKELVPNGYGRMVMKTTADTTQDINEETEEVGKDDEDDQDEGPEEEGLAADGGSKGKQQRKGKSAEPPLKVSQFAGIQIQVSFTGTGDRHLMQQLSGGQKALVALALIFAIQRCDPAPFYLFDEVDQALDSTYRAAVAALINRQAHSETNPAQFITSTFRPEMVRVADRCYGISHQNKVSNIDILDKETALEFVRELQSEEEALESDTGAGGGGKPRKKAPVLHTRRDGEEGVGVEEEEGDEEDQEDFMDEEGSESDVPSKKRVRNSGEGGRKGRTGGITVHTN